MEDSKKPGFSRLIYTVLFLLIGRITSIVIFAASIFQFIYSLIFSKPNDKVLEFTSSLSEFVKQIVSYVSFNSENKPWPIDNWPKPKIKKEK